MSARDPFVAAARDEIGRHWPGVTVAFSHRTNHRQATFTFNGASRFVIYAATPATDWCAVRSFLGNVRTTLAQLGAERVTTGIKSPHDKGRRRSAKRAHTPLQPRTEPLRLDPSRDPWAPLAALLEGAR